MVLGRQFMKLKGDWLIYFKRRSVAAYANRTRELGKRILDAQKREMRIILPDIRNSIEKHTKTSFLWIK